MKSQDYYNEAMRYGKQKDPTNPYFEAIDMLCNIAENRDRTIEDLQNTIKRLKERIEDLELRS